jgi:hypothetical protein
MCVSSSSSVVGSLSVGGFCVFFVKSVRRCVFFLSFGVYCINLFYLTPPSPSFSSFPTSIEIHVLIQTTRYECCCLFFFCDHKHVLFVFRVLSVPSHQANNGSGRMELSSPFQRNNSLDGGQVCMLNAAHVSFRRRDSISSTYLVWISHYKSFFRMSIPSFYSLRGKSVSKTLLRVVYNNKKNVIDIPFFFSVVSLNRSLMGTHTLVMPSFDFTTLACLSLFSCGLFTLGQYDDKRKQPCKFLRQ